MKFLFSFFCLLLGTYALAQVPPDYAQLDYWAAHPGKQDFSDSLPDGLTFMDATKQAVDVFFLYPTMYAGRRFKQTTPNADVNNAALNAQIDGRSILFQASVFNGVGRVFAPRYRQAHISYYTAKDTLAALKAFDLAYQDVLAAFKYYLRFENQGRPFIIAGHSQGSTHAIRLIKEEIDGQPIQKQLIVAYLVGMPVRKSEFTNIPVCSSPDQIGCFCSWRTVRPRHKPKGWLVGDGIAVTNPITWTTEAALAPRSLNLGAVVGPFNEVKSSFVSAQIDAQNGLLWCSKPDIRGAFLLKNLHAGDINLYYMNIRENVKLRALAFATYP